MKLNSLIEHLLHIQSVIKNPDPEITFWEEGNPGNSWTVASRYDNGFTVSNQITDDGNISLEIVELSQGK
jgi:hypothetical protein